MTTAQDLLKAVNAALKSDVIKMGSDESFKVTHIPTDILPIDMLFHGGLPRGRFVHCTGNWSTLKSYIGLKACARVQRDGGIAAIIDTEHAFDPEWAQTIGVNVDDLIVQHPATGELAVDAAEALIRGGADLIVFDSVAATLPQQEQAKRMHDESVQPARLAALMSLACRKLTAANSKTAILWINQLRTQIGVTFGNPEIAPGGRALPYYASLSVNIRKAGKVTREDRMWDGDKWTTSKTQVGQKFRAVIEKSKLSRPYAEVNFVWDLEKGGVDDIGFLIAQGLERGWITQPNNVTWQYKDTKINGKAKFRSWLTENPLAQKELRDRLMASVFPGVPELPKKREDVPKSKS